MANKARYFIARIFDASWTVKFLIPALGLFVLTLTSCKSSSNYKPGKPCEIVFRDFRAGTRMSLRNESLSPRSKFYSEMSDQHSAKVISDELMEVLVNRFESLGFFESCQNGNLPTVPIPGALSGISVRVEDRSKVLIRSSAMDVKQQTNIGQMVKSFRDLYDRTFQAQSVDKKGSEYFKEQQEKLEKQQKKEGAKP